MKREREKKKKLETEKTHKINNQRTSTARSAKHKKQKEKKNNYIIIRTSVRICVILRDSHGNNRPTSKSKSCPQKKTS